MLLQLLTSALRSGSNNAGTLQRAGSMQRGDSVKTPDMAALLGDNWL